MAVRQTREITVLTGESRTGAILLRAEAEHIFDPLGPRQPSMSREKPLPAFPEGLPA